MTQPDTLHTRLRAEIDRLLMAAHGADDGNGTWPQAEDLDRGMTYATRRFIELFSPLAIIAWLEAELEVLERHAPCADDHESDAGICSGGDCHTCAAFHPCPELQLLAHRLGMSIDPAQRDSSATTVPT